MSQLHQGLRALGFLLLDGILLLVFVFCFFPPFVLVYRGPVKKVCTLKGEGGRRSELEGIAKEYVEGTRKKRPPRILGFSCSVSLSVYVCE